MIADFHAKAIELINCGKLVACYSRSQLKADDFGKKYNCKGYSDLKKFLSHKSLDIVTICTPSGTHLDYALKVAEAGMNVIIEKPLEVTLNRCDKIIEIFEKNKLKIAVVFQSRFYDAANIFKNAIAENRFGKLVLGDAYVKWYRNQKYYDDDKWKGTIKFDGGGALMNQSIHAIDLLQWYMGPVDSVKAFMGILGHKRIEVEDTAIAILKFKSGALGVIEGSTATFPGFLKRIEISGTKGTAALEEDHLNVWSFADRNLGDDEIIENFFIKHKDKNIGGASNPSSISFFGHKKQFENFIESIERNDIPLVDGYEARKSVEIILAIYKSAYLDKTISLPL